MTKTPLQRIEEFLDSKQQCITIKDLGDAEHDIYYAVSTRNLKLEAALKEAITKIRQYSSEGSLTNIEFMTIDGHTLNKQMKETLEKIASILNGDEK